MRGTGKTSLDGMLFTAAHYLADYDFTPDTLTEDGDPLDALALVREPTFPGCRIRIRPFGVFRMEDQGKLGHEILGVPVGDPLWQQAAELGDVPLTC